MNAVVVRDFFTGRATAPQLAKELRDAFEQVSSQSRRLNMQDLDKDFEVKSEHLARLCDAVLPVSLLLKILKRSASGSLLLISLPGTANQRTDRVWRRRSMIGLRPKSITLSPRIQRASSKNGYSLAKTHSREQTLVPRLPNERCSRQALFGGALARKC